MSKNDAPLLEVRDLTVEIPGVLGERQIGLRRVSLSLERGETLVLAGEAGSGKSLLARLVAGIADPRARVLSGSVELAGEALLAAKRRRLLELRRTEITVIPPSAAAPPEPGRTVRRWLRDLRRLSAGNARKWVDCFHNAGLHEPERLLPRRLADLSPFTLKSLALVRAMLLGTSLLVSEDAEADLNECDAATYREALGRVRDEFGMGVLATTGTLRGVERHADRVAVFFEGGILEQGEPGAILPSPRFAYTRELRDCDPGLDIRGLDRRTRDLPLISRAALREAEDAVHQSASALDGTVTG